MVGGRRRVKRKWTGFIAGQRCWRGRLATLNDGRFVQIERVVRGKATIRIIQANGEVITQLFSAATKMLRLYKRPEAVLMGRLKRGVIERKSAKKAASCRRNGAMAVRLGHRKRGRPLWGAPISDQFVLKSRPLPSIDWSYERLMRRAIEDRSELDAAIKADEVKRGLSQPCVDSSNGRRPTRSLPAGPARTPSAGTAVPENPPGATQNGARQNNCR